MKTSTIKPLPLLVIFLLGFLLINAIRAALIESLFELDEDSINIKHLVLIGFNTFYTIITFWLIKKFNLVDLAGLSKKFKFKNWYLLLFPLYLVIVNIPDPGDINFEGVTKLNFILFGFWALSVGFSEEFMLRGFTQSLLLTKFVRTKTRVYLSVIGAALIFGLLHLLKFDKGLYGEITQVIFATFIGVMFGALLLRTNRIWPLIIIHALIDFAGNLDKLEVVKKVSGVSTTEDEIMNSILITLIVLPCFIYGLILLKRVKVEDIQLKLNN